MAAAGENGAGDGAHETGGAAAIDEAEASPRKGLAKFARRCFIDGVGTFGGAAINANVANQTRVSPGGDVFR